MDQDNPQLMRTKPIRDATKRPTAMLKDLHGSLSGSDHSLKVIYISSILYTSRVGCCAAALVKINRNMICFRYQDILVQNLLFSVKIQKMKMSLIFQHDSDPKHESKCWNSPVRAQSPIQSKNPGPKTGNPLTILRNLTVFAKKSGIKLKSLDV